MDDLSRLLTRLFSRVIGPKEVEPEEPLPHVLAERISDLEAALQNQLTQRTPLRKPGLAAE
jgi:hypothetical protein